MPNGSSIAACAAIAGAALVLADCAHAEVLTVEGVYPAGSDAAAQAASIAVERFGGREGAALSIGIEDALRDVHVYRKPWFALLPSGSDADATLRGTASSEVLREDRKEKRRQCVAKDEDGKCTEHADVEVDCIRRTVRLHYSVRLVSRDGELLHAADEEPEQQLTYCPRQDSNVKTVDATVRELTGQAAQAVRHALAPVHERREIRVMETRKGLSGEASDLFRQAVKLTKADQQAACDAWEGVDRQSPGNLSTVFNLGLCAEMRGALDSAEAFYRQALELSPGRDYPSEGVRRLAERRRADAQLAVHWGE